MVMDIDLISDIYVIKPRKPYEIHVSTLVICLRGEFFNYFFQPSQQVQSDEVLAGKLIHLVIQNKLSKNGYNIECRIEYDLDSPWKLVGRVDAMNNEEIIEIKTTKRFIDFNVPYWFDQINTYMHITGVSKGKLIVIERPTGRIFQKEVEYNEESANKIIDLANSLIKAIESKDVSKLPIFNDFRCKYCYYSWLCSKLR